MGDGFPPVLVGRTLPAPRAGNPPFVDGGGLRRESRVTVSQDGKRRAMKKFALSALPVVVLLAGAGLASAAERAVADATVPFAFTVSGKEIPAGKYEVLVEDPVVGTLLLRSLTGGKPTAMAFTTRLAMRKNDQDVMVFDVAGDKHYLSELHIAGADGYFFTGATGQHTHAEVKMLKK